MSELPITTYKSIVIDCVGQIDDADFENAIAKRFRLSDLGFDSLALMALTTQLHDVVGVFIEPDDISLRITLTDLLAQVNGELAKAGAT